MRHRNGVLKTPLQHFTLLLDGIVGELEHGFSCRKGRAVLGIKVWASDEAFDVAISIGQQIGFEANGKIELYKTDPLNPPSEIPSGYDINFTPYDTD